ncbi:uncharacterized protein Bfra_001156 [Botrytis fragariae]|uniref:Uncharacterized protein n=1 Tax=Botrytis fragariae TaxID=1964551 RepID=A0A8H6B4F4_9HELO|nr:uncharacterized protein Bfra_001156 [Botrytis fragariae]KAF5878983.1 hypothetical protein Bfra_001156 [Botrytis fragariae]
MEYEGDRRGRGRDRRREDYGSDAETVKQSHYSKSREATSKRPTGRAKRKDNREGPPLSTSAFSHGFVEANTARSEAPTIASISSKNHKSATVVGDEVYERDMRYGINDGRSREAAVDNFRTGMERRQGSLRKEDRDRVLSDWTQETVDRVRAAPPRSRSQAPGARTPSQAPSGRTHASRATENTMHTRDSRETGNTRESRPRTRAESVDPSSRTSHSTRLRAGSVDPSSRASHSSRLRSGSTAALDRNPVQRGASFSMSSSTTMMMSDDNNGTALYSQRQHQSSYRSSGNGRSYSEMDQTISIGLPRSGDIADSKYRPSRGGEVPKMVVDYSQSGIQRIRPGDTIGGDPARHRPLIKPLRRRNKLAGDGLFDNSQSGAKTITPSEASRLERDAASRSGYTERSGRPGDLRSMYSGRESQRTVPSMAPSSNSRHTLIPPPSLNSRREYRAPSTTLSHTRRLAEDEDLAVERDRYGRERY